MLTNRLQSIEKHPGLNQLLVKTVDSNIYRKETQLISNQDSIMFLYLIVIS